MKKIAADIISQVRKAENIAIITHINPDGDGFCAALALQGILWGMDKSSLIITDDDALSRYAFLTESATHPVNILPYKIAGNRKQDLLVILDCNSYDRLGERSELTNFADFTILLDHHVVEHNPIKADLQLIDTAYASVGALMFALFEQQIKSLQEPLRLYVANCLYTTLLNDTNNFANANTDKAVFVLASELYSLGVLPHVLNKEFLQNHSAEEMRYVGETLATIELHDNRKILTMHSTLDMRLRNKLDPDSVMNITRWVQGVNGLSAIVYLREDEPNSFKVSLRSVNLNVNKIAAIYGGGGHRQASGATITGELNQIKNELISQLSTAIAEFEPDSE